MRACPSLMALRWTVCAGLAAAAATRLAPILKAVDIALCVLSRRKVCCEEGRAGASYVRPESFPQSNEAFLLPPARAPILARGRTTKSLPLLRHQNKPSILHIRHFRDQIEKLVIATPRLP